MTATEKLKRSLQALAQPAHVQLSLFPDFAVVGDELALSFEEALSDLRASAPSVSASQAGTLAALDAYLSALSGPANAAFWTDSASLSADSRWEHIRELATAALVAFAWEPEIPPHDGNLYVSETEVVRNV